jgi:hypothetical protein
MSIVFVFSRSGSGSGSGSLAWFDFGFRLFFAGIRVTPSQRMRCLSVFSSRASAWRLRGAFAAQALPFGFLFAGIRVAPSQRMRCPYAGRHLLFFAAAKKSRQKKAAFNLRSPTG